MKDQLLVVVPSLEVYLNRLMKGLQSEIPRYRLKTFEISIVLRRLLEDKLVKKNLRSECQKTLRSNIFLFKLKLKIFVFYIF